MATLKQILGTENAKYFSKIEAYLDLDFRTICSDSRQAQSGALFLAVKGQQVDGRKFIDSAIAQGAKAVLFETDIPEQHLNFVFNEHIPCFAYYRLGQSVSLLAGNFYHHPAEKLTLVGVTGTNGKTTISQLLAQWANLLGERSAVMGTIGNGLLNHLHTTQNTTGSPLQIQQCLADFIKEKATFCAMEVSSHGLDQYRVAGLPFKAAIFTNLSRDHLDYHHTMANYADAKKRLFSDFHCPHKIINADDDIGKEWLIQFKDAIAVSCQPNFVPNQSQWLHATSIQFNANGVDITFNSTWGNGIIKTGLIGAFNVSNLLLTLATLLSLGYPLSQLCQTASQLKGVCGRMEMLNKTGFATAIVDYAHTPDALQKALAAARLHCHGTLWCIFGCGGDRDRGKRPIMGSIAAEFADEVILTDDNPRTENAAQILLEIQTGMPQDHSHWQAIHDRKQAIEYALSHATVDDVILIAGKGHEDYQIIGKEYLHFSDQEVVKNYQEDKTL
ncbi:UDP-N-acetylmuramoyl-L-alanyl-D-glutamate--2,6-diaminopimelate ligase [Actinobacillus delphinicola]|uniref:UDP-N-acetylmuramoyl-L-alanyl-D-glutamate--2, 6-diaminopimelate ligase n=1 Tax=Actinobacillus delphinicola TaxID=51161 RepID=UPI0024429AB2|nr:UDP-N-acetylmuramoyl-L-alanyl-D-glutamate--2,6-diaminopimelate ligase [Actinobacillus delphinicola]